MGGTKQGGLKARETNLRKYGANFYRHIGSLGGRAGHTGGFAKNPVLAKIAGAKGGRMSKRSHSYIYIAIPKNGAPAVTGSVSEIAKEVGCSTMSVYNACRHNQSVAGYEITRKYKDWNTEGGEKQ